MQFAICHAMPKDNHLPARGLRAFREKARRFPRILKILVEGDSWFDFPLPARHNVIDQLIPSTEYHKTAWLREEHVGDLALEMLSGTQLHRLRRLMREQEFHLLLFSGGGNDLVGEDLLPLLKEKKSGMTWRDCIEDDRLERRLDKIEGCFLDLIDLRNDFQPGCVIVSHTFSRMLFPRRRRCASLPRCLAARRGRRN